MRNLAFIATFIVLIFNNILNSYGQERAYTANEHLVYSVDYKIGFNVEVATVSMHTIYDNYNGKKHYKITATARVKPSFSWFYNLNHKYEIWLDSLTLRPSYFQNNLVEDNYRFSSSYNYDWDSMKVTTYGRNHNKPTGVTNVMDLEENSFDAISLFYQLRCINLDSLTLNKPNKLQVVFDDNIRTVYYRYIGKENINVKKIGRINVIILKCTLATSDGKPYEDGNELTIYLTDDDNKIPIYMYSPIKVGSVNVWLTYADGLLHSPYKIKKR